LEKTGLIESIYKATIYIDAGRKGFAIRGKADKGRISYEDGIEIALAAFQEAQNSKDPLIILLAESAFVTQEFQLCEKADTYSINSLSKAIADFNDAFLAIKALDELDCKVVDCFFPHKDKYRVKEGFPKDAFHLACDSHKTRLQNILRAPGIDLIEKSLLKQRLANLPVAQKRYIEKQKSVFGELNPI
jgi:hypothetical protein